MRKDDNTPNPSHIANAKKKAAERRERRREKLERKSKRAVKTVVRKAENTVLKGASVTMRILKKLNGPIRRRRERIDLD